MSQHDTPASPRIFLSPPQPPELPPDPGSRRLALLLWPIALILFGLVIWEQQSSNIASRVKQGQVVVTPDPNAVVDTPEEQMLAAMARAMVKMGVAMKQADPSAPIGSFQDMLDQQANTPSGKVRAVITAGELKDGTSALKRLTELEANAEIPAPLKQDLKTLRAIYEEKKADLTDDDRAALIKHHAKLGEIALTFKDGDTPKRAELLAGGAQLMLLIAVMGFAIFGAFILGFLLCPFMIIMFATRRLRTHFVPPAPGGSIFLETFVVFLISFLALKFVSGWLITSNPGERWPVYAAMAGQWLLVPVVLWPRVRGMSSAAWSSAVGLHAGRGFGREVVAGIVGYISGLPLLALAFLITVMAMIIKQMATKGASPPSNPIQEFLQQADLPLQILLAVTAFAWAPLVEELIFRGGIYRHLRGRMPVAVAAIVSALIFGFMHGYEPLLLLPVITLGFNFALIREWRGSLVASMTAHALHNGFLMLCALLALNMLG